MFGLAGRDKVRLVAAVPAGAGVEVLVQVRLGIAGNGGAAVGGKAAHVAARHNQVRRGSLGKDRTNRHGVVGTGSVRLGSQGTAGLG